MLYAPRLSTAEEVRAVCDAVSKPVNVLAWPGLTLEAIAGAGARRVSVGGRLTWVAVGAAKDAAQRLAEGDLSVAGLSAAASRSSADSSASTTSRVELLAGAGQQLLARGVLA